MTSVRVAHWAQIEASALVRTVRRLQDDYSSHVIIVLQCSKLLVIDLVTHSLSLLSVISCSDSTFEQKTQ